MAEIRFNYGDKFTQTSDSNTGIGSTIPAAKLDVAGGTSAGSLRVSGIATLSSYQGFVNTKLSTTENLIVEAGFYNEQYKSAGAKIVDKAEDIFNDSEIIVKVKEPLVNEVKMIRENQIVFTYLHLAAAKELTEGLVKSKSICIAYETVTDDNGRLPLLAPMSAVAGRMSVQAGAHCLEKNQKGRGLLLVLMRQRMEDT